MSERGADPRARGGDDAEPSAVDRYVTRIGKLYGSLATEQLDDLLRVGSNPLCTRAELWAAIQTMAAEWYLWGKDGDDVAERVAKRGTERVRALLGMEPEA